MKKIFLMTPGPTQVPPEVSASEGKPIIHHRTPEFETIFKDILSGLKKVFKTENTVLIFASSGTGAMESAVANLLCAGDTALTVAGGKFGERWTEICRAYGVNAIQIDVEWGYAVEPSLIEKYLKEHPEIKAVYATLNESSTGTATDIKSIGEIVHKTPAVLVVDAISGLGAMEMKTDEWHVDVCVSASQKALMLPPGLAFASISEKAWKLCEKSTLPKYYFCWKAGRKMLAENQTPYTPAVSLCVALQTALKMILDEGIDNVIARHTKLAEATRAAVKALGLELFSKSPSNALTAIKVPANIPGKELKNRIEKVYGITVAGGQAQLKGKIIRIAHLGYCTDADVILSISALERSLKDLGYPVELGKGLKAAQEILGA